MKPAKRPRDTNQLAKFLVDRACGETKEEAAAQRSAAAEMGAKGGKAERMR